jgi:hypothetical protein
MDFKIETDIPREIYTLTLLQEKAKFRSMGFKKFPLTAFSEFIDSNYSASHLSNFINDRTKSEYLLLELESFHNHLKQN